MMNTKSEDKIYNESKKIVNKKTNIFENTDTIKNIILFLNMQLYNVLIQKP